VDKTGQSRSGKALNDVGVGGTEGGRRPTGVPPTPEPTAGGGTSPLPPAAENQVLEKPNRRRFTAEYKLRILDEADRCVEPGTLGALLRREGLYSSLLSTWRRQREQGSLAGLAPRKRGRKSRPCDPLVEENRRLERQNQQLLARLEKAETIIDFQKKLSQLLGIPLNNPNQSENDA
jgi:transposase